MKTIKLIIAILALSIFAMSCSKDDEAKAIIDKPLEEFTIVTQKISTPVTPKLAYQGYESSSWFQLVGNDILYTCASNIGLGNPQFMLKYNLQSNTFSTITPNIEVCACGYMNGFITDGTNAFMIANEALKYTLATNAWSEIFYPTIIKENSGETGMSYTNGKIYVCGGRSPSKRFVSYNIDGNVWQNELNYLENITTSEMITIANKIYLLGGNATDKNFSYFDIPSNSWTAKSDLNFTLSPNEIVNKVTSTKERYLFVFEENKIYVYDTMKDIWKKDPIAIPIPASTKALNLFRQNDNTLLITGVSANRNFALYSLTIN